MKTDCVFSQSADDKGEGREKTGNMRVLHVHMARNQKTNHKYTKQENCCKNIDIKVSNTVFFITQTT